MEASTQEQVHEKMVTLLDQTREALAVMSEAYGNALAQLAQLMDVAEDDPTFAPGRQMLAESARLDGKLSKLVEDLR